MRWSVRVAFISLVATSVASPAFASGPINAWSGAGAPLAASAYVAPGAESAGAGAAANDLSTMAASENDRGWIFDEVRLGATAFWQENDGGTEDGVFITGQVLFDPFVAPLDNRYLDILLRPRPHFGASVSTESGANQVFGGLTWTVPIPPVFFLEASFGGTVHDGELEGAPISLGCRVLFRESLGLGVRLGDHWRVVGGVDHSSHTNLCGNDNDGLTHLGGSIGYRF